MIEMDDILWEYNVIQHETDLRRDLQCGREHSFSAM